MSSDPVLTCRQLSKTYRTQSGGIEALHAIDAGIMGGQVTALVGASGSGKSTLLRALAGLDRPTSGSLIANGHDLTTASPRDLRRHRADTVTYVSQKPADNLIPHLTLSQHAPGDPAHRILADVGLAHRLESLPIELSGGEQARAAFALAVARQNPLILIDEPTAELDHDSSLLLLQAINGHRDSGIAFVIATHDPDVAAIADNTLRLERGRLITHAGPASATKPPRRDLANQPPVLEARALAKSFAHSGVTSTPSPTPPSPCAGASSASSWAAPVPASQLSSPSSPAGSNPTPERSTRPAPPPSTGPSSATSPNDSASSPSSPSARTSSSLPASPRPTTPTRPASTSSSTTSASASSPTDAQPKQASANNNAPPWRAPSSSTPPSSSPTSPPPTRTPTGTTTSGRSSPRRPPTAPPASSPPTSPKPPPTPPRPGRSTKAYSPNGRRLKVPEGV